MHLENKLNENVKNTRYLRIFSLILALIILCTTILPNYSFAVADALPRIGLRQVIEGDSKEKAKVEIEYELQPIGGSPIPQGSRRSYRFTVTGNEDFTFAEIDFSKPGKYIYALKALEQKNGPKVNLDSSINKVEIDVYNQGDSFKEIFIYRNERGEKLESLIYKHTIKEDHNSQENKPQKPDKEKPDKTPKMGDIKMVYYFVALLLALIMLVNIRRKRKYGGKI